MTQPISSPAIVTRKAAKAAPSVAMQIETAQSPVGGSIPTTATNTAATTATTTTTTTTTTPSRAVKIHSKDIAEMVQDFLTLAEKEWPVESDPWIPVAQRQVPSTQVFRLENTINCFKVVAELETSPENAFDILADINRRTEWDELCEHGVVLESLDAGCKIDYMKTKGIWPTAPRDAVLLSYVQRLSDGRFLNVNRSIESELMLPKDSDGLVRMDAKIAGQIVGPSASGKPNTCKVVQVADGDLKGWIPKSVIGFIATQAVPMSFKTLNTIVSRLPERKVSEILTKAEQGGAYVNPGTNEFLASIVAAAADASAALPSSKSTLLLSTSPNSKDLASTAKTLLQSSSSMTNVSPIGASVNNNRSTSSASKSGGSGRRSSGPVRSFFSRVRRFFDWCTPYMVTIMFIIHMHRLIRDLRGRRTIGG